MMLNENRLDRLIDFADNLSINSHDNEEADAFFVALDYALGNAYEYFKNILSCTMVSDGKNMGARLMLELIDVNGTELTDDEAIQKIIDGLSREFGDYIFGDIENALSAAGDNIERSMIASRKVCFSSSGLSRNQIIRFCKMINDFVAAFLPYRFNGYGITFGEWDSMGFRFDERDRMNVPFYLLETLKYKE